MSNLKSLIPLDNEDIPEVVDLVAEAYQDFPYTVVFDASKVHSFLSHVPNRLMLGLVGSTGELHGVLLATITCLSISFDPVAVELFWYVRPEYRKGKYALQMVREYEKWAVSHGCKMLTMCNMANGSMETTGKFYQRLGYKLSEQTYFKDLI